MPRQSRSIHDDAVPGFTVVTGPPLALGRCCVSSIHDRRAGLNSSRHRYVSVELSAAGEFASQPRSVSLKRLGESAPGPSYGVGDTMPMIFVEGPPGLSDAAKKKMIKEVTQAADNAYHVPDVRLWLREYPPERYAQDGVIGAPVRPIAILEVPELGSIEAKRTLVRQIDAALAEAYDGLADTSNIMVFINGYPLEQVGWAGRMQSDRPEMVAAAKQLAG
jgi:phenylpyruvate tautomerase PptA (4-oxalocrotonate tautomerase family)